MSRLKVDLKENRRGEMIGSIELPADGTFTMEALTQVVTLFCSNNKLDPRDMLTDLLSLVTRRVN